MIEKYKWIIIKEIGKSASGKTSVFSVVNNLSLIQIGNIRWNSSYRKYAFYPEMETYYEEECLRDIATFLEKVKKERTPLTVKEKKQNKKIKGVNKT